MKRPYPWEASYPPGVRWDTPITTTTINALFESAVARHGNRSAIEYRDRQITFAELDQAVSRAASGFMKLGIKKGTGIALYLPNTPDHPICFLGALRTGGHVVHLSPLDAERELAHKLTDSGARILVVPDFPQLLGNAQKLVTAGLVDTLIVAEQAAWGPLPQPMPPAPAGAVTLTTLMNGEVPATKWPEVTPGDLAALQYTGGTTGSPKGAMLTHANFTAAISTYNIWAEGQDSLREAEDKVVAVLPFFHIYALTAILIRHLALGNEIMIRTRFDADTTLKDIAEKKATLMLGVPTMYIALLQHPEIGKRDLSSLRMITCGGASLPIEVEQKFEKITGYKVGGGWGMTETAPAGTNLPIKGDYKPGSIGMPLPGIVMQVVALEDPRRILGPNEKGEFRIKGPNVMSGYWKKPEETKAAFVDGFFLTGDIGYMDERGYFFLVDRKKDMILSGGFNVYPRIIEEAIYEHPSVEEVVVIGVPDEYRGQSAKAFVKLKTGATPLAIEDLRQFLADKIGKHEMPTLLEIREALPRTAVGKLSKKALVDEEARRHAGKGD
ncbi:MAG: dicarboxylate--CoA ligase PimA [Alphaproteobacteria bacterium]|nr:dicarboxylate--CoA ligase PimA [Alphaproteobacteria bacterium]